MEFPQPHPAQASAGASEGPASAPRQLAAGEGARWWGESWRIFCAAPGVWIGLCVIFVVLSIALYLVPIVGGLAHTLLTPVFAGGVMLGCHALAKGQPLTIAHLFEGFRRERLVPLVMLGLIWLAILFGIAAVMVVVVFLTLGASGLAAIMNYGMNYGDVAQFDYGALMAAGAAVMIVTLIAVAVVLLVAMAYWFAPALVVLNGEQPLDALRKSFAASCANIGAFLIYGLIYLGLAIVASIPVGLGWLVLGPMLVGSCYASWRTIFGR